MTKIHPKYGKESGIFRWKVLEKGLIFNMKYENYFKINMKESIVSYLENLEHRLQV